MLPRLLPALAGLTLGAVVLAGCSSSDPSDPVSSAEPSPTPTPIALDGAYVAMGDSYTSAPGVPQTELTSGCYRSDHNYPTVLSQRLQATGFTDVSCAGASTVSATQGGTSGQVEVPPQLDALTPDTALVTVGLGGNDNNVFATFTGTCLGAAADDRQGAPCEEQLGEQLTSAIASAGDQVAAYLGQVQARAPQAQVVLVGYPQPVPEEGTCAELPLAEGDYPYVRQAVEDLDAALEQAAQTAGVEYLDLLEASEGHDVCAGDDAWIQGVQSDPSRAIALHPLAVEQAAVADLLAEVVDPS